MAQTTAQERAPVTLDDLYQYLAEAAKSQKEALEAERKTREAEHKQQMEALEAERKTREAEHKQQMEALEAERKTREAERKTREAERKIREAERKIREAEREADRKDWEKQMKELGKNVGGVNNSLGEIVERLVASGIITRFKELGYTFDKMSRNNLVIAPDGEKREVDVELHNGEDIVFMEIKAKPGIEDVDDHVERITFLRNLKKYPGKNVYGAIAGAVFNENVKKYAIKQGFFVIEQSGDTMRIETLAGTFKPKKW